MSNQVLNIPNFSKDQFVFYVADRSPNVRQYVKDYNTLGALFGNSLPINITNFCHVAEIKKHIQADLNPDMLFADLDQTAEQIHFQQEFLLACLEEIKKMEQCKYGQH